MLESDFLAGKKGISIRIGFLCFITVIILPSDTLSLKRKKTEQERNSYHQLVPIINQSRNSVMTHYYSESSGGRMADEAHTAHTGRYCSL